MQELLKLNPANLTPRRPLSGYGLGIGRTSPALATPEPELVEAIPAEVSNPAPSAAAQGIVATASTTITPAGGAAAPAGAVHSGGQIDCPPEYPVKGNAQSKIFHTPQSRVYAQTIAEYCFASSEAAEAAGFRPPHH
jgi:large subunit ribosomal protein L17